MTLLTDKDEILARWAGHFNSLLNRQSHNSDEGIEDIPQLPMTEKLDMEPNRAEVPKATKSSSQTAKRQDGILPEVYKC